MSNPRKMKLEDLKMKEPDPIDWANSDEFFNINAPTALAKSLELTRVVQRTGILANPAVDSTLILSYLTKMKNDTTHMSQSLQNMHKDYQAKKVIYQGNYDENSHMYSLSLSFEIHDWLEQYENTIGQTINDVADYINSVQPTTPPVK